MSGGQRQRIGVLRGLAAEPDVVLMDEPFGALDPITRERLQGELLSLQENLHKTIIFVTHDIDEALKLGDRIVLMRGGMIEQVGSPEQLKNRPRNEFVRNFIGMDRLSNISPETSVAELVETAPLQVAPSLSAADTLERLEQAGRETAQVVDAKGRWYGMVALHRVKRIAAVGGTAADAAGLDRKVRVEEGTIRDAAEMLTDRDTPIPIIDAQEQFIGLITPAGIARLTIHRLTRGEKAAGADAGVEAGASVAAMRGVQES
jgi:osmoprotectant transport system ATP-binding protein